MTDFTLIHIYPALITLREVGSERPAFNAMGWRVPTPACCYQPGWVLVLCAPPRHKDGQQGLAGWHLTQHAAPLPQLGGPRGVAHVGTQGWVPSKWHLRRCVVGHGWWSSRLSCGHVRPCCATLCHAVPRRCTRPRRAMPTRPGCGRAAAVPPRQRALHTQHFKCFIWGKCCR